MKKFLSLLACVILLAACAGERWAKPGAGEEEYEQVKKDCTKMATDKFPPMMRIQSRTESVVTPDSTICTGAAGGAVKCQNVGGHLPPPIAGVDDNKADRTAEIRACLKRNGWHPVKE